MFYVLWTALIACGVVGFVLLRLGERQHEQLEGRHRLQLTSVLKEDTMILPVTRRREDEAMSGDSDEMKGRTQHDHQHDQAHAEHAVACPACSEEELIRRSMSERFLATDNARKALKDGIEAALKCGDVFEVREVLWRALTAHGAALIAQSKR